MRPTGTNQPIGSAGAPDDGAALLARRTWRTLEPLHGMIYFVPEAGAAYERLGLRGVGGYFASRAAPMGAVSADVVVSTFFNFNPELVHSVIPAAWETAPPDRLVAARLSAADGAFRRLLGDAVLASGEMRRAALLARAAAETAREHLEGRPLAAGHADLDWPDEPHLQLWHAQSILREFRGDGHVALLVVHGLSGIEALITHAAAGEVPARLLQSTRGWPAQAWEQGVDALRRRGWFEQGDELRFTEWGASQRDAIEVGTDVLAARPYEALGESRCAELRGLVRPWSKVFADALR